MQAGREGDARDLLRGDGEAFAGDAGELRHLVEVRRARAAALVQGPQQHVRPFAGRRLGPVHRATIAPPHRRPRQRRDAGGDACTGRFARKGFARDPPIGPDGFFSANGLRVLIAVWLPPWPECCSPAAREPDPPRERGPRVRGRLPDRRPTHLTAGEYTLRVHNEGPTEHELIVARTGGRALPLRADGLTVSEEALQSREAGALEPGRPGAVRDLKVHLAPGRYVLFCNMEGHYMAGMHAELVVSA